MKENRSKKWIIVTGGLVGLFVWAYDYDFFLNAGGPAAPLSQGILKAFHLQASEYPIPVLAPLLVLVVAGAAIGAVVTRLLRRRSR